MKKKEKEFGFETPELVEIIWTDSRTIGEGWQSLIDIPTDETKIKSVGYVAFENDKSLVLVQTVSEDNDIMGGVLIPKTAILSKRKI